MDEAGTNNARFNYRIERDNPPNDPDVSTQFTIDSDGSMSAMNLVHLANDPNIYTLRVIATDLGTDPMPMTGTATVVVTIQVSFIVIAVLLLSKL